VSFLTDVRFVRGYLAVGLAAVGSYYWLGGNACWMAISLYGFAGLVVGAVRLPRGSRMPWLVLATGVGLWIAGSVETGVERWLGRHPVPPRISDYIYLFAYPLIGLALILLVRQVSRRDFATTIDSLIVALTVATVLWPLMFATVIDSHGMTLKARLTVGTYPCWDVLFIALAARIALTRTLQTRRVILLLGGLTVFFVGDLFWFDALGTYVLGDWMDYMWLLGYVLLGAAALHPTQVVRSRAIQQESPQRFLFLAIPVALLPAAIVVEAVVGRRFTLVDGLLISALLLLLLGRLGSVVRGLEQARAELREQNRLKDELISVVSHDLRTPLTSIMGYLELALDSDTPAEDKRDFLDVVRRNTERLHRLVEDLLFVSRAQAGRTHLDLASVDLGALVREAVASAQPSATTADVTLECTIEATQTTLADAHRLSEVLENLLSNALKFTPPGGSVGVWLGRGADTLIVRVTDTGVGIAREDIEHLFDRFFRATGSDGIPGAGLGLAIVKAIVEAHGGQIEVRSRVGAGTTFEVRLPQRAPVQAREPSLAA